MKQKKHIYQLQYNILDLIINISTYTVLTRKSIFCAEQYTIFNYL